MTPALNHIFITTKIIHNFNYPQLATLFTSSCLAHPFNLINIKITLGTRNNTIYIPPTVTSSQNPSYIQFTTTLNSNTTP